MVSEEAKGASVCWLPDAELSRLLTAIVGESCRIATRSILQQRRSGNCGRVVELVTLETGRKMIVKLRNDREECRETLFYRHVLHRASGLVPTYLGGTTTARREHALVLEYLDGQPADWGNADHRALALRALAQFHVRFEGSRVEELLPTPVAPELRAEATPDPIGAGELAEIYIRAVRRGQRLLDPAVCDLLMRAAPAIIHTIAEEPLVLDPGDVRPENFILMPNRAVILDFENIGIRRRGIAVASLQINAPGPAETLAPYGAELLRLSRFPRDPAAFGRSIRASHVWLLLRALTDAGGAPLTPSNRDRWQFGQQFSESLVLAAAGLPDYLPNL